MNKKKLDQMLSNLIDHMADLSGPKGEKPKMEVLDMKAPGEDDEDEISEDAEHAIADDETPDLKALLAGDNEDAEGLEDDQADDEATDESEELPPEMRTKKKPFSK